MKLRQLTPCAVALALGASSQAFAAPGERALVTKFKTTSVAVVASAEVGGVQYTLTAQNYDDPDGTPQAAISVDRFDFSTFTNSFVICSGPRFAGTVTVNKNSGASSVIAVLDPTAADCYGFNSTTLTVNLSGVANGNYSISEDSVATTRTPEGVTRVLTQADAFDENFTGTIGYYSGALTGRALTSKVNQRVRVR